MSTKNILRIDASMRQEGSVSRLLADQTIDSLLTRYPDTTVTVRDLIDPVPQVDQLWIKANFTSTDKRTAVQQQTLELSDTLIGELFDADIIVIGAPMYNFGIPAALKAWVDQVARAGVTFKYTETGPVGLLEGKSAIVIATSGGVATGADNDFAVPYMRHVLGFIGISDVSVISADQLKLNSDTAIDRAHVQIKSLANAA